MLCEAKTSAPSAINLNLFATVALMHFCVRGVFFILSPNVIFPHRDIFESGDVAQWLVRRNSYPKTLGSIPWRGKGRGQFFSVPQSQHLCRLVCACPPPPPPPLLRVYGTHPQICAHVKDFISICRKRVGLIDGGMETRKHCIQEEGTSSVASSYGHSLSPGKAAQLSYYRTWNRFFILKVPEGGGAKRSTRRKTPESLPANRYHITEKIQTSREGIEPSPSNIVVMSSLGGERAPRLTKVSKCYYAFCPWGL